MQGLTLQRRRFLAAAGSGALATIASRAGAVWRAPKAMMPIGAWTAMENAGLLHAGGYGFIEEEVDRHLLPHASEAVFEKRLELAAAQPLPVRTLVRLLPPTMQSVGPDAAHDAIVNFCETVFRRSRRAGVETVVFGSPRARRVPAGFSVARAQEQLIALCHRLGPVAQAHGVTLALEPLNQSETNFINRVSEGAEIIRAVAHPNVRLVADFFHMVTEGEGAESIARNLDLIAHTQVAEKKGRRAPGVSGEDFSAYYAALAKGGYRGRLSVECLWTDLPQESPGAIRTIRSQLLRGNAGK